jgi:hypothetical protein
MTRTPNQRQTAALAIRMGYSTTEVGAALGVSKQAISSMLQRHTDGNRRAPLPKGLPAAALADIAAEWLTDALALDAEANPDRTLEPEADHGDL